MDSQQPDHPARFAGVRFDRQDVKLDGIAYEGCTFGPGCRLVFRGEAMPRLSECDAEGDVSFVLGGPARTTLEFLSVLYHESNDFGRELVEEVIRDLRGGAFQPK